MAKYKHECISVLKKYNGEKPQVIRQIIERSYKTWDNYSLSIRMLNLLYLLNFNGFSANNKLMTDFSQLLTVNIHPRCERRYSVSDTLSRFNDMVFREGLINDSNFNGTVKNIRANLEEFRTTLLITTQKMKGLTTNLTK